MHVTSSLFLRYWLMYISRSSIITSNSIPCYLDHHSIPYNLSLIPTKDGSSIRSRENTNQSRRSEGLCITEATQGGGQEEKIRMSEGNRGGVQHRKTFLVLCDFYPVNKRQLHDFLYLLLIFVFVFCFLVFLILFRWKSSAC